MKIQETKKTHETLGIVTGSLIGALLAGIGVYVKIPQVCISMILFICLCGGWYIGKQVEKEK